MKKPCRNTEASRQERKSRDQLKECFEDMGWTAAEPPDLGEDFIFSVYFGGVATGVAFYAQLKSVADLNQRKKGNSLRYRFEVKDLKHWKDFALPVVLIVWDVNRREGRWAFADSAVADLDRLSPKWRTQKTATVSLPWQNTTDGIGLQHLKSGVGKRLYPIIAKGRALSMDVSLVFDNTPNGKKALEEWERFYKEGEQAVFRGHTIRDIKFSEWWQPWDEGFDPDRVELIIGSKPSSETHLTVVDISTPTGLMVSLPNIEMRTVRMGMEVACFSNSHQAAPFQIDLKLNLQTREIKITISLNKGDLGYNVTETLRTLNFCQAMSVGGKMVITFLDHPEGPIEVEICGGSQWEPDKDLLEIVRKLCKIQEKMGVRLRIPEEGISAADIEAIEELVEIIDHGRTVRKRTGAVWTVSVDRPNTLLGIYKKGASILGRQSFGGTYTDLFGVRILKGPMTRQITGILDVPREELEQASSLLAPGEPLVLKIHDPEVTEAYDNWRTESGKEVS